MKPGSLVQIIPELQGEEDYRVLWDSPPNFTNIYLKNHVGRFHYSETGIILEQKYISETNLPLHVQTTWVKVLCSGGTGWIKRCDVELVR